MIKLRQRLGMSNEIICSYIEQNQEKFGGIFSSSIIDKIPILLLISSKDNLHLFPPEVRSEFNNYVRQKIRDCRQADLDAGDELPNALRTIVLFLNNVDEQTKKILVKGLIEGILPKYINANVHVAFWAIVCLMRI